MTANKALHATHPRCFASRVFPRSLRSLGARENAGVMRADDRSAMAGTAAKITIVGVLVCTFAVHYVLQFVGWAAHEGHAVPGSGGSRPVWWEAPSFPTFWLVPDVFSMSHFDMLLLINSGAWATAATVLWCLWWRFARGAA